jgi:hypothetical protein
MARLLRRRIELGSCRATAPLTFPDHPWPIGPEPVTVPEDTTPNRGLRTLAPFSADAVMCQSSLPFPTPDDQGKRHKIGSKGSSYD